MNSMSPKERLLAALRFEKPDRVPLYDGFWEEFVIAWRREKGLPDGADIADYYGLDLVVVVPDETPFSSQQRILESAQSYQLARTGWGAVERTVSGAKFSEALQVAALISYEDYEAILEELDDLRAARRAQQVYEEWKRDPSSGTPWEEVKAQLLAERFLDE